MSKKYTLSRKSADKHLLYQWAVQDAEFEVVFAAEQYERRCGGQPKVLREDFCGTALVASHWVKDQPQRRAIGLDLDGPTLDWARQHNLAAVRADRERVELRQVDVRTVTSPKADIIQAFNFSYSFFHPVTALVEYFECVRDSLAPGGLFMLDCFGGWATQRLQKERRTVESPAGSFGFVWEHAAFNPINNESLFHIHFEFKNGKWWKKAFSYNFRLYTPAELCDALTAAGFQNIEVLWDFEENSHAACDYRVASHAENCPGWIVYLIAESSQE